MIVVSVFLFLALIIILMNPFIVLIHELGHATPALIFTKNVNIKVYVGSYGDEKNTLKFRIGRLSFFIKYSYNFFRIKGLCVLPEQLSSFNKKLIFITCGPAINLFTVLIAFYFVYNFADDGPFKVIMTIFICYSFFIFFVNLIPRSFISKDGKIRKTDGKQIQDLFRIKKLAVHAKKGDVYFADKKYELALIEYQKCIKYGANPLLISSSLVYIYTIKKI